MAFCPENRALWHGPGLIASRKWPFPRKTRRAGSEERVFCLCFGAHQNAHQNMAFSRAAQATQAVYCLLAAVYFLWPFPEPHRRRRLSTVYLLLSTFFGLFQNRPGGTGCLLSTCRCLLSLAFSRAVPATISEPLPLPHRSRPYPKTHPLESRRSLTTKHGGGVGVRAGAPKHRPSPANPNRRAFPPLLPPQSRHLSKNQPTGPFCSLGEGEGAGGEDEGQSPAPQKHRPFQNFGCRILSPLSLTPLSG